MINPMDLTGKKFLVTGASAGIGKETAIHLSRLGASVILLARNIEELEKTMGQMEGSEHSFFSFDLTNIEDIEKCICRIVAQSGRFNGLVHCAGVAPMRGLQMTTYEFVHKVMLINFYSFLELVRVGAKKGNYVTEGASFVGISSVMSKQGEKGRSAYCASKGAMDSSIHALAKELAGKNIRINSIAPGFIGTELYTDYNAIVESTEAEKALFLRQYLGLGRANNIANAVAFLLSDASNFITGSNMVVDGGYLS